MKNLTLIAVVAGICGCATQQPESPARASTVVTVGPALPDAVVGCQYLDDVTSVSSRYGVFASAALDDTRAQVLTKADALGATHLVWDAPVMAAGSTTSRGKAYRCS